MPVIRNEYKTIHKQSDRDGNTFMILQEPVYGNWKVYIHLHNEKYKRMIGQIDTQNRIMFVERDKSKHYHREMMAYGFNYTVIDKIANLKKVLMLETDGTRQTFYLIPVEFIKANSKVKNFQKSGFEIQYFLRYEYLERFIFTGRFEKGRVRVG